LNRGKTARGFSLTEVLIGVVFLAVGLLAVATLQMTSVRGNTFSHQLTQATYLAHDRLEYLKALPFDDSQLRAGQYADRRNTAQGIQFRGEYTVSDDDNLKTIRYTVRWNDGRDHSLTFSTIRSQ
jgi:Tfp pilus assembly protein PilV